MLAKRIIPCFDVANGRVVKGVKFVDLRDAGDPVEQAAIYDAEGADELVFLDILASHESRGTTVEMARKVADAVFIPFTIGGGVRGPEDFRTLLLAGADKCSINSAAVRKPELVNESCYATGWLIRLRPSDPAELGRLLDAAAYAKSVESRAS